MWMISKLWKKYQRNDNIGKPNEEIGHHEGIETQEDHKPYDDTKPNEAIKLSTTPTTYLLCENSPRKDTPKECPIPLWPHQQAMLYRIQEIEQKGILCQTDHTEAAKNRYMDKSMIDHPPQVCLGIMNDPPGSGKTYAILTAILSDPQGPTIIIVPQNIYGQWRASIEIIFQDQLDKCKFSHFYGDIMDIYGNPKIINRFQVILLQDSFAEAFLKVLNDKNVSVRRIVIDEIDIMDKFICSSVQTNYVWLMSASYHNQPRLGPYFIEKIEDVLCKCDTAFVQESLQLPGPIPIVLECDDEHVQLFDGILDAKQIKALHAGDFKILNRIMNVSGTSVTPYTIKEITKTYAEYLMKKTEELGILQTTFQDFKQVDERSEKEYNLLRDSISLLQTYRKHSEQLMERLQTLPDLKDPKQVNKENSENSEKTEDSENKENSEKTENSENKENSENIKEEIEISKKKIKETYLEEEFPKEMQEDKTSKWLIFNDNGNTLIQYQNYLNGKEIRTTMLDGGNQKKIEKALEDYKKGETQVLLLNSMIEGAGMNLENTTHLLFMHKTEEKFIDQVIGRAQRYGRTKPLKIIMLFNKHE